MSHFVSQFSSAIEQVLPMVEATYKDIHQHPELSLQEVRTASIVAQKLRDAGFTVTEHVGKTGVVGLLKNGEGPIVMMRADKEETYDCQERDNSSSEAGCIFHVQGQRQAIARHRPERGHLLALCPDDPQHQPNHGE